MNKITVKLDEVITPTTITFGLDVLTKIQALEQISKLLLEQDRIVEKEGFIEDILERESLGTTNMGIGVAIPHGKSLSVSRNTIAIARLARPIKWDSNEEEPVRVIVLLAVRDNDEKNEVHMELISKVATLLLQETFLNTLFTTNNKMELIQQIHKLLGEK